MVQNEKFTIIFLLFLFFNYFQIEGLEYKVEPDQVFLHTAGTDNLLMFASASSCLPDQYTLNYSDPNCYTCPIGKYRSIPSAWSQETPGFAPWLPMGLTWDGAVWTYMNRFYGGYGPYYPVYYTPFWPAAGGGGCSYFITWRWFFYYTSPSIDGTGCPVGGGGFLSFGPESQMQTALSQSTNIIWCQDCPENKVCPIGSYISYNCSNGKVAECKYCHAGTYAVNVSQSACKPCPAGTFTALSGQSSCTACPLNTFNNELGGWVCSSCPSGTYSPRLGATACINCPNGYFFSQNVTTSCSECTNT